MNIGIIGGGMVAIAHLKALQNMSGVECVYLYARNSANAEKLAINFSKICIADSIRMVVESSDGIIIATPNNTHLEILKSIVEVNAIPVLCEKPLSSSYEDALAFYQTSPPLSAVAFNYRFNHALLSLNEIRNKENLGKILHLNLALNRNSARTKKTIGWRDDGSQNKSGGACGDLGSHLLDMVSYLTGQNIAENSLEASLEIKNPIREGVTLTEDDHCIMAGVTDNGASFSIQASKSVEDEEVGLHLHIVFEAGEIKYSSNSMPHALTLQLNTSTNLVPIETNSMIHIPDPGTEVSFWSDSFYLQNEAWVQQITTKNIDNRLANIATGLKVQQLLSIAISSPHKKTAISSMFLSTPTENSISTTFTCSK
jgi:glucose-6-phosphate 3-dehydrogenase